MAKSDLLSETFDKIVKRYGENMNPAQIPVQHRTVVLVLHAHGILGNGGFHYLFEGDLPGDPEFLLTRQAFKTIGAARASSAFQKAFSVFPNSTPPEDIGHRLEMWESKYTLMDIINDKQSPDAIYFHAMDETMQLLDEYIRVNRKLFDSHE